ncbi:MAG: iron-sulfur cluster-binding domain-containing protein, partial [Pseudomonadota bacterium]
FMSFRRTVNGEPVERCYTLSSSAASERTVEITVKRKAGGVLSGALHDGFGVGDTIDAFGPAGRFGPVAVPSVRYLLLSAGSGVTPMLSVLRTAADLGIDLDAAFVQVASHPRDLIAADDVRALLRRLPNVRWLPVVTAAPKRFAGSVGRLTGERLAALVPDLATRAVLSCGPEEFMRDMRAACLSHGVRESQYLEESFQFVEETAPVETGGPVRRVTFARTSRTFDCPDGLTILQAAKAAGVPVPSSCTKGICGTCKTLMLQGEVDMSHNGGIRDREVARGFILPCSSRPNTDIVLDR